MNGEIYLVLYSLVKIATTEIEINTGGKVAAITRRNFSATTLLPPRSRGDFFAACVHTHAGTVVMALDAFLLAIVLIGKAKDVLVLHHGPVVSFGRYGK